MTASQATTELLTEYFAVMEAKDTDRLGTYYADGITLKFANADLVVGRDAVLAQMIDLLERVESLAHVPVTVWEVGDGVVVFEVDSIWTLKGGQVVTIRACSVFTVVDRRFTDQRIYVDNAPIDGLLG